MIKHWLQAARLPSQVYIFVPILVGQLLATGGIRAMDWTVFILAHLVGLFDQLFIVFSNDYFDLETDRENKHHNMFSGGSRVLVEDKIKPSAMHRAYQLMAILALICSVLIAFTSEAVYAPIFVIAALLLMVFYSFPPVQLSYRGGGELLQAIGVGLLLPTFGFYVQAGNLTVFPWQLLWILLPTQLSCALSTTLTDHPSDKKSNKRTLAVLISPMKVRPLIVALQCFAIYQLGVHAGVGPILISSFFAVLFLMITISYWPVKTEKKPVIYIGLNIFLTTVITLSTLHIMLGL